MRFGAVFPHQGVPHTGPDIVALVSAVEDAGFDYLSVPDHVLRPDPSTLVDGAVKVFDFHEVFVLFAFIAAQSRLELVTGVLVLPQRQTALVAKQVADLDLLLDGRLRLGVAIGWNELEYAVLDVPSSSKGARLEEQIEILRRLWTEESVTYEGRFHHIDRAGIAPLPLQRPIPIWIGGAGKQRTRFPARNDLVLNRIGRIGNGWISEPAPLEQLESSWKVIGEAAAAAGRDPRDLGLQVLTDLPTDENFDELARKMVEWRRIGVTHLSFRTASGRVLQDHLDELHAAVGRLEKLKLEG